MTILSRLSMANLPPMLRAELEELDEALEAALTDAEAAAVAAATAIEQATAANSRSWQRYSQLLTVIGALPSDSVGALELVQSDLAAIRPINTDDDGSLATRGGSMAFLGKGSTALRPTVPAGIAGTYFDTSVGRPIFWNLTGWIDATGASV